MTLLEKLDEIRKSVDGATPGPWYSDKEGMIYKPAPPPIDINSNVIQVLFSKRMNRDGEFIAASRTNVDQLEKALRVASTYLQNTHGWLAAETLTEINRLMGCS